MPRRLLVPAPVLALALALLLPASSVHADRVELQTGEVLQGRIIHASETELRIVLDRGGTLSLPLTRVRRCRLSAASKITLPPLPGDQPAKRDPVTRKSPFRSEQNSNRRRTPQPRRARRGTAAASGDASALRNAPPVTAPPSRSTPDSGQPPSPAAAPEYPEPALSEDRVVDAELGFSIALPPNFAEWRQGRNPPAVVRAFRDPLSHASLTATSYASELHVVQLKEKAAGDYAKIFDQYRITRDERLPDRKDEVWVLEASARIGGVAVHQTQIFAQRGKNAIVLTLSSTSDHFFARQDVFRRTVSSFKVVGVGSKGEEPATRETSSGR